MKRHRQFLVEAAGWTGIVLIAVAYCLVSFGVISGQSVTYQILNVFGAIGIITSSSVKKDYQPVLLNIFWLIIALASLLRSLT